MTARAELPERIVVALRNLRNAVHNASLGYDTMANVQTAEAEVHMAIRESLDEAERRGDRAGYKAAMAER